MPISGSAEVHANDAVARARRVLVQERLERHEARPHLHIRRLEEVVPLGLTAWGRMRRRRTL
jgi:hypothetical protein